MPNDPVSEIAYYYPNPVWDSGDWIKNLILFFDGVALLVPSYLKEKQRTSDLAIVAGLEQYGLLHILDPERVIDAAATEQLANALNDMMLSGSFDQLDMNQHFHELSISRIGFFGNEEMANKLLQDLISRGFARESEDGKSIPMHPQIRYIILVLLSQILRGYGPQMGARLSPITDRAERMDALTELLSKKVIPTTGAVVAFDMATVGVDVGSVPIDEVLAFRKENYAKHRRYMLSARVFAQEISKLSDEEREATYELRQAELDDLASELRKAARKAWRKPSGFGLSLTGAAVGLAHGSPLAACLSMGASLLNFSPTSKPDAGAYSYLFRASGRYPLS